MQRMAISSLIMFMQKDIEISTADKANLLAASALGYFFTQVPGGKLADKFGAKIVVTFAMGLSAAGCLALPSMFDAFGISGIWFTMVIIGAVQGPMFPTSFVVLSRWLPKQVPGGSDEKAWSTSMLDIGISIGALLVIPVTSYLATAVSWRFAFQAIGLAGMGFVATWHLVAAEVPGKCLFISEAELKFLEENVPKPQAKPSSKADGAQSTDSAGMLGMPTKLFFTSGVWAVFFAHIAFNYGAYYLTNWSPTYYSDVLKMKPDDAMLKWHLMMPHIFNLSSKALNPILLKCVSNTGKGTLFSRRVFTVTGFSIAAVLMLPVHQLRGLNPWVSTLLFSVANASFGFAPCGFKANYLDITQQYVGIISGYGNTLATAASFCGPHVVAFLLQRFESWDVVLASVALVNLAAAANFWLHATVVPIESTGDAKAKDQ